MITPEIRFSKNIYEFGEDTHVTGEIILPPGVDMSTISNISVEYQIIAGASDEDDTNDVRDSVTIKLDKKELSPTDLHFSFALKYPYIQQHHGLNLDDDLSFLENHITVTIKETSFFSRDSTVSKLIPIHWSALEIQKLIPHETDDTSGAAIERIGANNPVMMALPWDDTDTIAREYYESRVQSSWMSRLGDILYTHPIIRHFHMIAWIGFFVTMLVSVGMEGAIVGEFGKQIGYIAHSLLVIFCLYLPLQYLPKWILKKSCNIDRFFPEIRTDTEILSTLHTPSMHIADLFQQGSTSLVSNPLIGVSGKLSMHYLMEYTHAHGTGKHRRSYNCILLDGEIYQTRFSSIETLTTSSQVLNLDSWFIHSLDIASIEDVTIDKILTIQIQYDNLPDKTYTIEF